MADDFAIRGADDMLRLSKHLKALGETGLRKDLNRGLRNAAKPVIKAQRSAARRDLPQRGGLARQVGRASLRAQVRTGSEPGVRIVAKGTDASQTDAGRVRHPVFGKRRVFVEQQVKGGWFSETPKTQVAAVRREVQAVMQDVASRIGRVT
jgi:hypothetical protein